MKITITKELIKDLQIKDLLERFILEKYQRYESVKGNIVDESECLELLKNPTFENVKKLYKSYEASQESKLIESSLNRMCFDLTSISKKNTSTTEWEKMYHYATEVVRMEDVVKYFLGEINLKHNISCPFHKDKKPSFKVYPKTNTFYCFSCNARGSPIDFIMKLKDCQFKEAVQILFTL